jgi:hypothetical protein
MSNTSNEPKRSSAREQLWLFMSDLYLDTDVRRFLPNLALRMTESNFSRTTLEHIFQHEVTPVVHMNMLITTGEWSGFDEQWLLAKCEKRMRYAAKPGVIRQALLLLAYHLQNHAHQDWLTALALYDLLLAMPQQQRQPRAQLWQKFVSVYFDQRVPRQDDVHLVNSAKEANLQGMQRADLIALFETELEPLLQRRLVSDHDPNKNQAKRNVLVVIALMSES